MSSTLGDRKDKGRRLKGFFFSLLNLFTRLFFLDVRSYLLPKIRYYDTFPRGRKLGFWEREGGGKKWGDFLKNLKNSFRALRRSC